MKKDFLDNKYDQFHRIGIIGGTFDPIHHGHLFIAETAYNELKLDKIVFIPSALPPHKMNKKVTDFSHRLNMTQAATENNNHFIVSTIENNRQDKSYTIDTIKELREKYSNKEFYFITGADAFCELHTWKKYDQLMELVKFVVMTRNSSSMDKLIKKVNKFKEQYNACIIMIEIPTLDISSTDIRNRIKNRQTIKYLLPMEVEKYIVKNKLYVD